MRAPGTLRVGDPVRGTEHDDYAVHESCPAQSPDGWYSCTRLPHAKSGQHEAAGGSQIQYVWREPVLDTPENRVSAADAVGFLDGMDPSDPERAHFAADDVLLSVVPADVAAAYVRLQERCTWWVTA